MIEAKIEWEGRAIHNIRIINKDGLDKIKMHIAKVVKNNNNKPYSLCFAKKFQEESDRLNWWVDSDKMCQYCQKARERFPWKPYYWWERYCLRHGTIFWFRDNIYLSGRYAKGYIHVIYDEENDMINQINIEACNSRRCGNLTWTPGEITAKVFAPFRYRNYGDPRSSYCFFTRLIFVYIGIGPL